MFNPAFLRSKDLPVPAWLDDKTEIRIPYEQA
jgi:cysteine synthase A